MTKQPKQKKGFDIYEYLEKLKHESEGAPEPEEILAEIERGDFSSFDPQFLKDVEKDRQKLTKMKKRQQKPARKPADKIAV